MDCLDSYESTLTKIGDGKDEKGDYKIMELVMEIPCNCHTETCCHFDGKTTTTTKFKQYKDGSKSTLK